MSISCDMAVSACVPGPVFGDTVYGRMGETAFLLPNFGINHSARFKIAEVPVKPENKRTEEKMRIFNMINLGVSVLIIMMFLETGCNKTDKGKIDKFALSFALRYTSDETQTYNDAVIRFHSFPRKDYAMPEMAEFSIVSCNVTEWQGVKSYHYSVAHTINDPNDVKNNWYGTSLHGDGSFLFGFRKTVYLNFVVEADEKGNLRIGNVTPVWKRASGKSAEVYLNDTKRVIRQKTGRYP